MSYFLGIDLGTTNSVAAVYDADMKEPQVIPVDHGKTLLPSVVSFLSPEEWYVGELAMNRAEVAPEETVRSVKREMGSLRAWTIHGREYTPVDISALILGYIKTEVEKHLGETVTDAVITVPAYFKDDQLRQTREAGQKAGFNVMALLPEPAAAALAYGLKVGEMSKARKFLVYDLGGGTFDVCMMDIQGFNHKFLNIAGNPRLGGDDFDWRIIQRLADVFKEVEGVDLLDESSGDGLEKRQAKQLLWQHARAAKERLSELPSDGTTAVEIVGLFQGKGLQYVLSRREFEDQISDLLQQTQELLQQCLRDSGVAKEEISRTILMGGSTKIPKVRDVIKAVMDREPYGELSASEGVAMGAAIYAHFQGRPDEAVTISDERWNLPETLGIRITQGANRNVFFPLIKKGALCPFDLTPIEQKFTTASAKQDTVYVKIYQQPEPERECQGNPVTFIEAKGIQPDPKGKPEIQVRIGVDRDRIVIAEAHQIRDGKPERLKISIYPSGQGPVVQKRPPVDIVFVVDTTGSMEPYIEGVKLKITEFADALSAQGTDFRLGLVDFKDLILSEPMVTYPFTNDVGRFRSYAQAMHDNFGGGGDYPESSLEAIMKAAENSGALKYRDEAERMLILITDAPPHIKGQDGLTEGHTLDEVKRQLTRTQTTLFAITDNLTKCKEPYRASVSVEDFLFTISDMGSAYETEATALAGRNALANVLTKVASRITDITLQE